MWSAETRRLTPGLAAFAERPETAAADITLRHGILGTVVRHSAASHTIVRRGMS